MREHLLIIPKNRSSPTSAAATSWARGLGRSFCMLACYPPSFLPKAWHRLWQVTAKQTIPLILDPWGSSLHEDTDLIGLVAILHFLHLSVVHDDPVPAEKDSWKETSFWRRSSDLVNLFCFFHWSYLRLSDLLPSAVNMRFCTQKVMVITRISLLCS